MTGVIISERMKDRENWGCLHWRAELSVGTCTGDILVLQGRVGASSDPGQAPSHSQMDCWASPGTGTTHGGEAGAEVLTWELPRFSRVL